MAKELTHQQFNDKAKELGAVRVLTYKDDRSKVSAAHFTPYQAPWFRVVITFAHGRNATWSLHVTGPMPSGGESAADMDTWTETFEAAKKLLNWTLQETYV